MNQGRFIGQSLLTSLVTVAALLAVASGARAATTLGETFSPPSEPFFRCLPNDQTWLQSTSPGASYAAQSGGVITSWSFQGGASDVPPQLKFKVARNVGVNMFTIVGESAPVNPAVNTLITNSVQIPVQTNDIIGFWSAGGRQCRSAMGYVDHRRAGDAALGSTLTYGFLDPNLQLDVSALLETDCDKDGLGDETQDTNLSTCAPGTGPGTAPGTGQSNKPLATCKRLPATIVGTDGNDVRVASPGRDVIAGLGGNDTLAGLGGNDLICGGAGKDKLKGGQGKDTLLGQKGKDRLKGGPGRDLCKGGKSRDTASGCEVEKSI
jgi:RTX calcium-binding nonapeptide repeat (4 copies)